MKQQVLKLGPRAPAVQDPTNTLGDISQGPTPLQIFECVRFIPKITNPLCSSIYPLFEHWLI